MSNSTVRPVLLVDALVSGATGLLLAFAAPMLESWLGLPAPLLRYAGIILLPFALVVGWIGKSAAPPRGAVKAIVATNFAWVAASILLLVAGRVTPTALGVGFVLFQAAVVFVLGELQFMGLRKAAKIA
jgi:hypothetical protein